MLKKYEIISKFDKNVDKSSIRLKYKLFRKNTIT